MDQALVDAALGDLGCPVWVNQLAGYHHAAAPVQRPGEGVHVEADQRAVGTERLAGGDADVGAELGGQQVEAGVLATRRARSRTIRRRCDELGFRRGGCAWCLLARCCWSAFGPPKMDWRGPFRARVRCLSWWRTPMGGRRAVEGARFQVGTNVRAQFVLRTGHLAQLCYHLAQMCGTHLAQM